MLVFPLRPVMHPARVITSTIAVVIAKIMVKYGVLLYSSLIVSSFSCAMLFVCCLLISTAPDFTSAVQCAVVHREKDLHQTSLMVDRDAGCS